MHYTDHVKKAVERMMGMGFFLVALLVVSMLLSELSWSRAEDACKQLQMYEGKHIRKRAVRRNKNAS